MKKTVLDKWCISQDDVAKHYCHICGICLNEKEIRNSEGEQYFCSKHKGLSYPNVLLIDERLFKTVFKTMKGILQKNYASELTFQVGRDGVRFRYMDQSHVSLTELHLYVKAFKAIKIDFPLPKTFTISLDELGKVFKKLERNNEVLIRFNEDNIQLSFLGKGYNYNKNAQEKSFSLKLLNTPVWDIPEPELKFQVVIKIKTSAFIQALKKIKKFAHYENTYFECTSNSFQIYAYDNDINKISESFSKSQLFNIWTESEVSSVYDSNYIFTLIDCLKQYINIVQIRYSYRMPILFTAKLNNSGQAENYQSYLGYVRFYQAPRILDV